MSSNKPFFSAIRRKIVISFVVLSSLILVVSSAVMILLVRWEITRQSRLTIQAALTSVRADYQANRLSKSRIGSVFQFDNRASVSYQETQQLPKVSDSKTMSAAEVANAEVAAPKDVFSQAKNFAALEKNHQVYSRVIAKNGDVLITSDLFEKFNIDPSEAGFFTIDSGSSCFHVMTSQPDETGTVVQVGQYCAFSQRQQLTLFIVMLFVTLGAVIATYLVGWLMAGYFLHPMEKAIQQTRQFAENCYHELMTPLAVAMSSVSAGLKSKKYQEGLHSVDEDLKAVYDILQTLTKNTLLQQSQYQYQKIVMGEVLKQCLAEHSSSAKKRALSFDLSQIHADVKLMTDKATAQRVIDNIITNAVKYAQESSTIMIELTPQYFSVSNTVSSSTKVDTHLLFERGYRGGNAVGVPGNGYGLAISKELAEAIGWKISAQQKNGFFVLTVGFMLKSQ
jgi:K+-sensing histidine kinase KdpD